MNSVISPGDKVSVTSMKKGFDRGKLRAVVVAWAENGRLKVRYYSGRTAVVSADNVKKIADAKPNEE